MKTPRPIFTGDAPPVDHMAGFKSKADVRAYLAAFADRKDDEIASFDLWSRPTTFGDLRRLAGPAIRQESLSLFSEQEDCPA